MYQFRDVTEVSEGTLLPSEALKINGEYIENLIEGYRTLSVSGREALSPDVLSEQTGTGDGSRLKNKRYPERIIRVKYQLIAQSNEAFREAYNKLGYILNVENAELIFNDEQDKFYTGTPCIIGEVEEGRNAVIGSFEILCVDPFKYSVVEYEATADLDESSVLIDYNGTYKSFPTLVAEFYKESEVAEDGETATALTGAGDCGYVAFFTEDEQIIQLGNPDEVDGEEVYPKSQTLIGQGFNGADAWGGAAQKLWTLNNGVTSSGSVSPVGNVGIGVASYTLVTTAADTSGVLKVATSRAEAPDVNYRVTAKVTERKATTAKVTLTVTSSLGRDSSYFGHGFGLVGSIFLMGSWYNITLKKTSDYWRGKTGHTVNKTIAVSGLQAESVYITGIKFKVSRSDSVGGQTGVLSETNCAMLPVSMFEPKIPASYYLQAVNYGSGENWHGASITRAVPADRTGEVGAKNCSLTYSHKFAIGTGNNATNQLGCFQAFLVSDRKIVAGVGVFKGNSGKKATLRFYVGGVVAKDVTVDVSNGNAYFTADKTSVITKTGDTVSFNIGGLKHTFRDSEIADTAITEVTFTFLQFGTKPAIEYNGLYSVKFNKNNCNTLKDIPNKFSANDVVEADCKNAEISLNGVLAPELGALGNDWETFCLTAGLNQIGIAYSEWVSAEYAPSFKVRYREVFL